MKQVFSEWYHRYFTEPEAAVILVLLVFSLIIIYSVGQVFAPVFAGMVLAYLLEGLVQRIERFKLPHWLAVSIVFVFFIGFLALTLFVLFPIFMRQVTSFFTELPSMISKGQAILMQLPEKYPEFVSAEQVQTFLMQLKREIGRFGQTMLSFSIASIPALIGIVIYLVLVPLLVFFFLLDRDILVDWFKRYLPKNRPVLKKIWSEVDIQLGNYIRGKVLEILIVAAVSYFAFIVMGIQYAFLLAVLVGLSVLIPFIGVTLVSFPVIIIAFLQWGWSAHFAYFVIVYAIICLLDANLLVPLLFSEVVNLHPVAIIVAILFFGGLWGFWGVFFAIPLATVVQAILVAWPKKEAPLS